MNDMTAIRKPGCRACSTTAFVFPFRMAFQPVVDIRRGEIHAYEALVRGPDGGAAQRVLQQVTAQNVYAFDQAARVKAIETAAGLGVVTRLNINFMPNAVYDPRACIRKTLDAASRTGFNTDRITFEITEDEQVADEDHLREIITEYRRRGFRVALDDFGKGYSGLSRLARLHPDILKLDRDLIAGCGDDAVRREIIMAMARLCRAIGVELVAEGVENEAELAVVRDAGIDFVQGFYFARPALERLVTVAEMPPLG